MAALPDSPQKGPERYPGDTRPPFAPGNLEGLPTAPAARAWSTPSPMPWSPSCRLRRHGRPVRVRLRGGLVGMGRGAPPAAPCLDRRARPAVRAGPAGRRRPQAGRAPSRRPPSAVAPGPWCHQASPESSPAEPSVPPILSTPRCLPIYRRRRGPGGASGVTPAGVRPPGSMCGGVGRRRARIRNGSWPYLRPQPGRSASSSPFIRCASKRLRHTPTGCLFIPTFGAIWPLDTPSAVSTDPEKIAARPVPKLRPEGVHHQTRLDGHRARTPLALRDADLDDT